MVGILGMLMHWIDILMLGYFLIPEDVGVYQPAARTTGIIRLFLVSFSGIFAPMISEFIANNSKTEMKQIYQLTCRWMLTLSIPFFIVAITRSEQIMNLFGDKFILGSNILVILMVGILFMAIGNPAGSTLVMAGKTNLVLVNTLIISILNISFNIYFIPRLGLIGAAWGTTISLVILSIARLIQVWIYYRIQPFEMKIFKSILSGIILYFISIYSSIYLQNFHYFLNLCITFSALISLYIILMFVLKLENEDLDVINAIKLKIKGESY